MGELARYFNAELQLGARCTSCPRPGGAASCGSTRPGCPWVRPSPNLPTLASATVYPALVAFEGSNLSVGRGTTDAFQAFGAPWLPADGVAAALNARGLPGVRFERIDLAPRAAGDGKYSGKTIPGVRIVSRIATGSRPGRTAAAILWAVQRAAPESLVVRGAVFDDRAIWRYPFVLLSVRNARW